MSITVYKFIFGIYFLILGGCTYLPVQIINIVLLELTLSSLSSLSLVSALLIYLSTLAINVIYSRLVILL